MENATNKKVISIPEILGIFLVFSFIFYSLYPKDKIFQYVVKENENIELTEIYLKNIVSKYPNQLKFLLSLLDLYIKQNKLEQANQIITQYEKNSKKDRNEFIELYKNRIKLNLLTDKQNSDLEKLKHFYYSDIIWGNPEKEKYIEEFINKMIYIKDYQTAKFVLDQVITKNNNWENKKIAFLNYINLIKSEPSFSKEAEKIKNYEDYFIRDIKISNIIITTYLQANRPNMARNFSIKILKNKNII